MNAQEWDPHEVLKESPNEISLAKTVLQQSEADVARTEEHNRRRQPDLKTVQIESIHRELKSKEDVVEDTNRNRTGNTVCARYGQHNQESPVTQKNTQ